MEDDMNIETTNPIIGIFNKPLEILKKISDENKLENKPTICSLLIDEKNLHQKYEKFMGKTWGYSEGMGNANVQEPKKMASKAVVIVVISLTQNWKIPIGLFFIHNPDIKCFADTIEDCLTKLDVINIKVISLTMNCLSPHLSFALAEELGIETDFLNSNSKSITTHFPHPISGAVYMIYDLDILVGSLKNYWQSKKTLAHKGNLIDYDLTNKIRKISENDLQSYNADAVFDWFIIKKRLSYDCNISKTTADALMYLKDLGHPQFQKSGESAKFIMILDYLSKFVNATKPINEDFYMAPEYESHWKPVILNIIDYVKKLKRIVHDTPEHLSIFKICTTGIIVSLTSIIQIYETYIKVKDSALSDCSGHPLPYRVALRNIRQLFDIWSSDQVTTLGLYKKTESLMVDTHLIFAD